MEEISVPSIHINTMLNYLDKRRDAHSQKNYNQILDDISLLGGRTFFVSYILKNKRHLISKYGLAENLKNISSEVEAKIQEKIYLYILTGGIEAALCEGNNKSLLKEGTTIEYSVGEEKNGHYLLTMIFTV